MMDGLPCGKTRKVLLNECKQPIGVVYTPKRQRTVLVANKEGVVERMKTSFRKELVGSMALVSELEMFDDSIYMLDSSILRGGDKIYSVSAWGLKSSVTIIGLHNVKSWLSKLASTIAHGKRVSFDAEAEDDFYFGHMLNGKVLFI